MSAVERGLDPNKAIKSYFQDPDWLFKTGLGGLFNSAAFLLLFIHQILIPLTFCLSALNVGYMLRVMRHKMADEDSLLPKWNDLQDLFISGLTWIAVFTGQMLLILSVVTISLLVGGGIGSLYALSSGFLIWASITVAATSLIWLSVWFFSSMIMTNFAEKERTAAAFDLVTVFRLFKQEPLQFIQAWLLSIGLHWLALIVPVISIIGLPLVPMSLFVAGNVSATLFAQVWALAKEEVL